MSGRLKPLSCKSSSARDASRSRCRTSHRAAPSQPFGRSPGTATAASSTGRNEPRSETRLPITALPAPSAWASPPSRPTGDEISCAASSGLRTAQSPGVVMRLRPDGATRLTAATRPLVWPLRLNASEVLAVSAWPSATNRCPGNPPAPAALSADTRHYRRHSGHRASDCTWVQCEPGAQPVVSALRHTHVLGPTGTGKSTAAGAPHRPRHRGRPRRRRGRPAG